LLQVQALTLYPQQPVALCPILNLRKRPLFPKSQRYIFDEDNPSGPVEGSSKFSMNLQIAAYSSSIEPSDESRQQSFLSKAPTIYDGDYGDNS
jgi:hypothetical protein